MERTMTTQGFALFDTAIGRCGIVWGTRGVVGVQLPETNETAMRARLPRRFPRAHETVPPADVQQAIGAITALLRGEACDLTSVALDMTDVPAFHRSVYAIARTIAPGHTLTYGEIATRLGDRSVARDVGQALGQNPFPIVVPCHRVLAAGGRIGGFSAPGGTTTKWRLLAIEGSHLNASPTLFDFAAAARSRGG
jgi:methylated-DNA-[protein]-cysteine S-methyltransferase